MKYREVTPQQRGGLSEAIVTSHRYEMYEVFGEWAINDLRENENICLTSTDEIRVRKREMEKWAKCHAGDDEYTWMPDACFEVEVFDIQQTELGYVDGKFTTKELVEKFTYLIEVKTGKTGSLKRDQRDVMESIEESDKPTIPVRVRIDIDRLPDIYGIHFTRIHGRH
jgi:hypothetical protein